MLSALHCFISGCSGSPGAGKKWGKGEASAENHDFQPAERPWLMAGGGGARGKYSLLPEPGERMRIQAGGPGRGPEPLFNSLPPGKGEGAVQPEGVAWTTVELGVGGYWPSCCSTPWPCQSPRPCGASQASGSLCARRGHKGRREPQLPPPAPPHPTCMLGGLLFTRGWHLSSMY